MLKYEYIMPFIMLIPLSVIQLYVIPFLSFNYVAPDLLLVMLVYFTLRNGQVYGALLGFVLGGIFDLISGGLIGSHMFAYTLSGFIAGYFYNENKVVYNTHSFAFLFILLICGTASAISDSFISSPVQSFNIATILIEQGLLPGMYSSAIAFPFVFFSPGKRLI